MKKMRKISTIKNRMLAYSFLIIAFMAILSIYTLNLTNRYKEQIDGMFQKNILLTAIADKIEQVDQELVAFLSSKSSNRLNAFMIQAQELGDIAEQLKTDKASYNEEQLMVEDINQMITDYLKKSNQAIAAKRERNVNAYTDTYKNASLTKSYILRYITELNMRQFGRNASNYITMSKQIESLKQISIVLMVDLILLSICIVYVMSYQMIKPIIKLSRSAEDIAKGHFDTEEIVVKSDDELKILAIAFNKMKNNLKAYIEELRSKAETEAKLKDQEMENLTMQHLLDNAKLYALQSQINPHFLFNTINAGVQMAMLEGADRTSEFLESMSSLFRYNIKQINSVVTLKQELDNIKDYYDLLKVRFGDLIKFRFRIDESALDIKMPPLIFQPIVENSYIHGLSSIEDGGTISIQVLSSAIETIIVIEDNGKGMTEEKIQMILSKEQRNEGTNQKSSGIGMRNVIERLELFFDQKDILSISSRINEGTKIVIKIKGSS